MNEAYCATTSGGGADSAAPDFLAAFLTGAFAGFAGAAFFGAAFRTAAFGATFFVFGGAAFIDGFLVTGFWTAGSRFAAAALFAAHRFFVAAIIAAFPAADSLRFGFKGSGLTGADLDSGWSLALAHLLRCASPIRFRAAALIWRRLPFGASGAATDSVRPAGSGPEFGDLGVVTELLLFKTYDGGVDDFGTGVGAWASRLVWLDSTSDIQPHQLLGSLKTGG